MRDGSDSSASKVQRLRLDKQNGKLMGVSAGIANYFDVDVTIVRIAWVLATLLGMGSLILVYILVGMIAD